MNNSYRYITLVMYWSTPVKQLQQYYINDYKVAILLYIYKDLVLLCTMVPHYIGVFMFCVLAI